MITKFRLVISFTAALLILSFFIWVYSLTESLEGEKEKRARAEDKAEVALIERDVALAISEEQSLYAQSKQEQAAQLETMLLEIKDMPEYETSCETVIIDTTIDRLYEN